MGRSDPIIASKAVSIRNVSHVILIEPEISAQDEVSVVALEPRTIHEHWYRKNCFPNRKVSQSRLWWLDLIYLIICASFYLSVQSFGALRLR